MGNSKSLYTCTIFRLISLWGRANQPCVDASLRIGYARVSSSAQRLDLQLHALRLAGCDLVYGENAQGSDLERAGLEAALLRCQPADEILVWKLDRLSRRQLHVVQILDYLAASGVNFRVVDGLGSSIDSSQKEGRILLGVLAGFGEYEWESIRARSTAGKRAQRTNLWRRVEGGHAQRFNKVALKREFARRRELTGSDHLIRSG